MFFPEPPGPSIPHTPFWKATFGMDPVRVSFVFFNADGTPALEVRDHESQGRSYQRCYSPIARWGRSPNQVPKTEIWSFPLSVARDLGDLQREFPLKEHDILFRREEDHRRGHIPRYSVVALPDRWYPTLIQMPCEQEMASLHDPSNWPFQAMVYDAERPRYQWDWFSACSLIRQNSEPGLHHGHFGCLVQVWDAEGHRKEQYLTRCNAGALLQDPHYWIFEAPDTTKVASMMDVVFQGWRVD